MDNHLEIDAAQLALQQRIRELEAENTRLARALEERQGAEKTLAESERRQRELTNLLEADQARLAAVLQHLPVGVWIADGHGRLIGSNDAADRIWAGQSPLLSSTAEYQTYIAWHSDSGKRLEADEYPVAVALRTGQAVEPIELEIQRFDGSQGTVLVSAVPIKDRQGKVTGAVGVNVDISERKKLEEALGESEYRFRTMADGTPLIIWVTNAEGVMDFINQAYTDFFGVTLEEVQSGTWQMLVHPEDHAAYVDVYMECLKERRPFHAQCRALRKDGQWRWLVSYGQPRLSESGDFLGMAGSSLDITERVQAEESLRESEMKFHGAFQHAAIGYALTTLEGRFVDGNAAYSRLTGYSPEELDRLQFSQLIHPDDYDKNMELHRQLLAGEIPDYVIENRYLRKNGQFIWVRKSVSLVAGPKGEPKWLLALVEDISEQKQAEQALRESEKIYRAIGEAIPYGIWICDPDGRNIYASQSYLDLVGITQEQCYEFGWGDTLHPDDAERAIAAWKECVRSEGLWDIEHRFLGKDGQYHPILARGIPVRDDEGKIIYWAGINLDISRLKKVEQALKTSEEHFKVALKNSPMLVYTTDRELRYTWIYNPPFGVPASEIIGKTDEELDGFEQVAELVTLKRSVLESGVGRREEIRWQYEGADYYYDVTVEPMRNEEEEITGLTVAAIDITDKKRMEQIAREHQVQIELQRRLMEQREQERLLIAQEIHDGPSQTLAGTLLELELTKSTFSDPTLQLELNQIRLNIKNAVRELRGIIAELRPPLLERFGLSRAIEAHAEEFKERYPGLALTHEIAEDRGKLSRDAGLSLFRIYQEALNNIVRHANATRASVRLSFSDELAVLEIEDNGRGLPVMPDLTSQTAQGHYGLAGMKERAEAVSGTFQLRSAPGNGTTVTVRIPVSKDR